MKELHTTTRLVTYHSNYHGAVRTAMKLFGADAPISAVEFQGRKCAEVLYTRLGGPMGLEEVNHYRDMLAEGEALWIEQTTEYADGSKRILKTNFGF